MTSADVALLLLDGNALSKHQIKAQLQDKVSPEYFVRRVYQAKTLNLWASVNAFFHRLIYYLVKRGYAELLDFDGAPLKDTKRTTYKVRLTDAGLRWYGRKKRRQMDLVPDNKPALEINEAIRTEYFFGPRTRGMKAIAASYGLTEWGVRKILGRTSRSKQKRKKQTAILPHCANQQTTEVS